VHEEETSHLTTFSGHAVVNYAIEDSYYTSVANDPGFKIGAPESGTSTVAVSGFDTIEDALNFIVASGIAPLNPTSGTPTTLSGYSTIEEAVLDIQDTKVDRSGDTMTGFLTLHADPTVSGHAATKQYVDNELSTVSGANGNVQAYSFSEGIIGSANTYSTEARLIWSGSDKVGVPVSISALLSTSNTGYIRIYDVTNALTVAELVAFTGTTPTIRDLGALTNVSSAPAVWEIQLRKSGGGANTTCFGLNIEF
jgi:hypothetical protein